MKKVTFVQVNYSPKGRGINIMVLRGNIMRTYRYSSLRVAWLMLAAQNWDIKFYGDKKTLRPR